MRDWIKLIIEATDDHEEQLDERAPFVATINNVEVTIMENPLRSMVLHRVNPQNMGWFRGFLTKDQNVFLWDAYLADHYFLGSTLGLSGKTFEIRSGKGDNYSTMLYLTAGEYPNREEWRTIPKITRMLPENFHIGPLRH